MSNSSLRALPPSISSVLVILVFGALSNFGIGIHLLFNSSASIITTLPLWYLIANGTLALMLGIFYIWLARLIYAQQPIARVLAISIAAANIVFALTRMPAGWPTLALNIVVIVLLSQKNSLAWLAR